MAIALVNPDTIVDSTSPLIESSNTMTGKTFLSHLVQHRTYAKYLKEHNRRETKSETITRNMQMHIDKYPHLEDKIVEAYQPVYDGLVLPSMRSMQFAGEALLRRNQRGYNCAYVAIDDLQAFQDLFMMSMSGCGVGYSVRRSHVSKLPVIQPGRKGMFIRIPDSAEGWAGSILALLQNSKIGFDYADIRKAGSPLSTGGTASGPEALQKMHELVRGILTSAAGRQLTSFECHRICCLIADCVVVGGVRRAALICLFDYDDLQMLHSKAGEWYKVNPEFARANISAVVHKSDPEFAVKVRKVMEACFKGGQGEPGLILTNSDDYGVNPCAEISLLSCGVCNLTEIVASKCKNSDDFVKAACSAAAIGTLQASYTDFVGVRPTWKAVAEREALLGVSITGQAECQELLTSDVLLYGAGRTIKCNKAWAEDLGINPARRIGTTKPSGTASLYSSTTPGIHAGHAKRYFRRVRLDKDTALAAAIQEHFQGFVVDDPMSPNNCIIQVPVRLDKNSLLAKDESPIQALDRAKFIYKNWVLPSHVEGPNSHNVSQTVTYRPGDEEQVMQWLIDNKDFYLGISFLPYDDTHYQYMPFSNSIDKETFEIVEKQFKQLSTGFDFKNVLEFKDNTTMKSESACSGGLCVLDI